MNITPLRTSMRTDIATMVCTWVTSLESRVISEPVENRSVCSNERFMM